MHVYREGILIEFSYVNQKVWSTVMSVATQWGHNFHFKLLPCPWCFLPEQAISLPINTSTAGQGPNHLPTQVSPVWPKKGSNNWLAKDKGGWSCTVEALMSCNSRAEIWCCRILDTNLKNWVFLCPIFRILVLPNIWTLNNSEKSHSFELGGVKAECTCGWPTSLQFPKRTNMYS